MTTERMPVTAKSASFTFYDIESLSNAFTMCAYTPRGDTAIDDLEVFYLLDDQDLAAEVSYRGMLDAIRASNPGLPRVNVAFRDLSTAEGNLRLAALLGLSDAGQVCDPKQESSYPANLRPVCDTDPDYKSAEHPFLAGYNSFNYDTTMLALYLSEVFKSVVTYKTRIANTRQQVAAARGTHNYESAQQQLRELESHQPDFAPIKASTMREYNNDLFTSEYIDYMPGYLGWDTSAGKVRQSMMRSGRHLDVARLNELQQKVGLKRLLGMLGYQIKESDKLGHDSVITTAEELYELLAYNVSDCLGLSQLFEHPTYSSNFDLKAGLLAQYSETVYAKNGSVRRDRLTIDSSSAKFVGRILSPFGVLQDIEAVSFDYPHKAIADERGIEQVNVLDECVKFFESEIVPDRDTNPAQADAYRQFMEVVAYYRDIEGKNFNDSDEYAEIFTLPAHQLATIPKRPNNLPYFHADGSPSSCFATFSYGGIHGAEIDEKSYSMDSAANRQQAEMITIARHVLPEATAFIAAAKDQHNALRLPDGSTVDKRLVLIGSDPDKVRYRKPKKGEPEQNEQLARAQEQMPDPADLLATQRPDDDKLNVVLTDGTVLEGKVVLANTTATKAAYREEPAQKKPELFPMQDPEGKKGVVDTSTKLHSKYTHTSAGMVIHEDFTSYYPNLLRNMRAFYNPDLGEDRYAKIFFDKERYGREMKTPGISAEEKTRLNTLRNGTKLILNSASGAGDAQHKNPIRMNNQIISMRIMGQLFSWRIGQAQTREGGRIISTNTDGLYSVIAATGTDGAFTAETNNRVLAEQQAAINIDIEPEPLFLISKDSNNRLELGPPKDRPDLEHLIKPENVIRDDRGFNLDGLEVHAAGGGTLACHGGPRPDKSLAHPAVIDFGLARYLQTVASRGEDALSEPFDHDLGAKIIDEALDYENPVKTIKLFQNVLAASRGSITYPFAADPIGRGEDVVITNARPLQMINRVLIVRDDTPGAVSLHNAGAWKVSPASREKRAADPELERVVRTNQVALDILAAHGWTSTRHEANQQGMALLPEDQDVITRKINSIEPTWSMIICNDDLHALEPAMLSTMLTRLDLDVYVQMLGETFTKNWKNA